MNEYYGPVIQVYIFNSILNIFGKYVTENINLMLTFADSEDPLALEAAKKEGIPFAESGIFKFNNSATYYRTTVEGAARFFWNFGFSSLERFFRRIASVKTTSLALTFQVLVLHCF